MNTERPTQDLLMPVNTHRAWNTPAFQAPRRLRSWLTSRDSLTARLVRQHGSIRVQVLRQSMGMPNRDEVVAAGLRRRHLALIREVLLMREQQPVVFAHTVAGRGALRGEFGMIRRQGATPLGATLFANPRVQRSRLHTTRLRRSHPLWNGMRTNLPELPQTLWARRSSFRLGRTCLLVTEVFLPAHLDALS